MSGIEALSNIIKVGEVSLYTLSQLAKDNGLEVYVYKMKHKDLPLVVRPAILHSKGKFIFTLNGKALEKLPYSGFVMTLRSMSGKIANPVSRKIAKLVKGG